MNRYLSVVFILVTALAHGQALRDINYSYQYNPDAEVSFEMKPVKQNNNWIILYNLRVAAPNSAQNYQIQWQSRDALNSKAEGIVSMTTSEPIQTPTGTTGQITFPVSGAPKILVAKIVNDSLKRAWLFYKILSDTYPVNTFLTADNTPVMQSFVNRAQQVALNDSTTTYHVFYYNDKFPSAAPGFSEAQAKVSREMKADSVYTIQANTAITFPKDGLYLFQKDTLATEGLAVRAESDYPRYSLIPNLPGPLIYICTKQEYDRLENANGDKKVFDRTVLNITGDAERAKILIRNYFRRVELANQYFTSYKEGWKTDRGMIYIIFGVPDQVLKFADREVWNYKNETFNISFDFVKSSSLFDPENYVLIRNKKFQQVWYEVIDLWRNARF